MMALRVHRGPRQPYFPPGRIEEMCLDELRRTDLLPQSPGPVRIDRFIERRFGRAHEYAALSSAGLLGMTLFLGSSVDRIIVDSNLEDGSESNERRVRTTLAHEAGHGLLHATLFGGIAEARSLFGELTDEGGVRMLCRASNIGGEGGGKKYHWAEYQANKAIGGLLLPTPLVRVAVTPFLEPTGSMGMLTLPLAGVGEASRSLAEIFDVNRIVVELRLTALFPTVPKGQLSL